MDSCIAWLATVTGSSTSFCGSSRARSTAVAARPAATRNGSGKGVMGIACRRSPVSPNWDPGHSGYRRTLGGMSDTTKRVLLAKPRGYCAGVDRAVVTVEKALETYGPPVYVRKEIVHNK